MGKILDDPNSSFSRSLSRNLGEDPYPQPQGSHRLSNLGLPNQNTARNDRVSKKFLVPGGGTSSFHWLRCPRRRHKCLSPESPGLLSRDTFQAGGRASASGICSGFLRDALFSQTRVWRCCLPPLPRSGCIRRRFGYRRPNLHLLNGPRVVMNEAPDPSGPEQSERDARSSAHFPPTAGGGPVRGMPQTPGLPQLVQK